jgi:hypothetical protein
VKRIIWLFAFTPLLASVLLGDWKIVTTTGNGSVTEFFKGELVRSDSSPEYSTVIDYDHRRQVTWRNDLRQYAVVEWPPASRSDLPQAKVISIERHTSDTGQRKQFFGRTAHRLVTRVTRNDGPETTIDGWYIDAPGLPKWKSGSAGSFAVLTSYVEGGQTPGPPRIEVKQTGPVPKGLPVWQKTTSSILLAGSSPRNYESVTEVSELTEGVLPDKLFQPPAGYQRVASLAGVASHPAPRTWSELLQAHRRMLEDWLSTVF